MIGVSAGVSSAEQLLPALDRRSRIPYHVQLRDVLKEAIADGHWKPGDRLPTEQQLCDHFDISRSPVRQAMAALESDGLIRREVGRGTFVAEPPTSAFIQSTASFHEEATNRGHTVRSDVLRREVTKLPAWAARVLTGDSNVEGVVLERLRYLDGAPVMLVHNYLPAAFADAVMAADLEDGSLYQVLRQDHGVEPSGGRRTLSAAAADDETASRLGLDPGDPVLVIESVAWDEREMPIETYVAWHRTEHTRIEVQVIGRDVGERAGLAPFRLDRGDR